MKTPIKSLTFIFILFLCIFLNIEKGYAQNYTADWIWAMNAGAYGQIAAYNIEVDNEGNTYVSGIFKEDVKFGDISLYASKEDIFVAKLGINGKWLWAVQTDSDPQFGAFGQSVTIDTVGNIYIVGTFGTSTRFGNINLTSEGVENIFVAKLNNNGKWVWAVKAGGKDMDLGNGITIDKNANLYITGSFIDSADFGNFKLTSSGSFDIFVAKLNSEGQWQWATKAGGAFWDEGRSITVDSAENIYVMGYSESDTIRFGSNIHVAKAGSYMFFTKLNKNGQWEWIESANGVFPMYGQSIKLDKLGNIYSSGYFQGSVKFGNTTLSSLGDLDIFVCKLDTSGHYEWAIQAGGVDLDYCQDFALDSSGSVYITALFAGTAYIGNTALTSAGGRDILIAKINNSGSLQWAIREGNINNEGGTTITVDSKGYIYIAGFFQNTLKFGNKNLETYKNQTDLFVAKFQNVTEVGIQEIWNKSISIKLYPNPATNILTIETSKATNIPIIISDITGRQIMQVNSTNETKHNIDVSSLAKGLYFISIDQTINKFIKE